MELKCEEINNYIQRNQYNYLPRYNYQYHAQAILGKLGKALLYFSDDKGYHLLCLCNPYNSESQADLNFLVHFQSSNGSKWKFNKIRAVFPQGIEKISAELTREDSQVYLHFIYQTKESLFQEIVLFQQYKNWESLKKTSLPLDLIRFSNPLDTDVKWYNQKGDWKSIKIVQDEETKAVSMMLYQDLLKDEIRSKGKDYRLNFPNHLEKELFNKQKWLIEDVISDEEHYYFLMTNQSGSLVKEIQLELAGKQILNIDPAQTSTEMPQAYSQTALVTVRKPDDKEESLTAAFQIIEHGPDFSSPKFLSNSDTGKKVDYLSYIGLMQAEQYVLTHNFSKFWMGVLTAPRHVKLDLEEKELTFGSHQALRLSSLESLYIGNEALDFHPESEEVKIEADSQVNWFQFLQANHYLRLTLSDVSFQIIYAFDYNQADSQAFNLNYNSDSGNVTVKRCLKESPLIKDKLRDYSEKTINLNNQGQSNPIEIECLRDTNSLELIINRREILSFIFYEKYAGYDLTIKSQNDPLKIMNIEVAKIKIN